MTPKLAWCFSSEDDARDCVAGLYEQFGSEEQFHASYRDEQYGDGGFAVYVSAMRDIPEVRAFVMGFACARNDGVDMRDNPIKRNQAIASARFLVRDILANHVSIASEDAGAVNAHDAAILARYVLGMSPDGVSADLLGTLGKEVSR